jgi:hypothetical protein
MASAVLLTGLGVYLMPLQPSIVALQFTFSTEAFLAVLQAWKPAGVELFRSHLAVDGVLMLCYGAFGYLLAIRTAVFGRMSSEARHKLSLMMPVAACADAMENILHWLITGNTAEAWLWLVPLASVCASVKFAGIFGFGAAVWLARRPTPAPTPESCE